MKLGKLAWLAAAPWLAATAPPVWGGPAEEAPEGIEEVFVFGDRDNQTGSRLGLTIMESPATVEIIDGDAIRERLDTSVLEAVTRTAGFTNDAHHANGNQNIAARGFFGQGSVTKLFDGANYYNAFNTLCRGLRKKAVILANLFFAPKQCGARIVSTNYVTVTASRARTAPLRSSFLISVVPAPAPVISRPTPETQWPTATILLFEDARS